MRCVQVIGILFELPLEWPPLIVDWGAWLSGLLSFSIGQLAAPECETLDASDDADVYELKFWLSHL
jgi:hypothetical protein